MKKLFLDANVIIDLLTERHPWFIEVQQIFSLADMGKVKLYYEINL